jgi:hypothetical protein
MRTVASCIQTERRPGTRKWEEVDHEDSLAGQLVGPSGSTEGEGDPLGLGAFIESVHASMHPIIEVVDLRTFNDSMSDMDMESRSPIPHISLRHT